MTGRSITNLSVYKEDVLCMICDKRVLIYDNSNEQVRIRRYICENGHYGAEVVQCEHCLRAFLHKNKRKYCSICLRKQCVYCHKVFEAKHMDALYCSFECKKQALSKECVVCGKLFLPTHKRKNTCSAMCRKIHQSNKKTFSCKWCKKLFEVSEIKDVIQPLSFCSKMCENAYYKKRKNPQPLKRSSSQNLLSVKRSIQALVTILIEPRLEVERRFGSYYDVNQETFSENLKEYVRKRDGYKCAVCGFDQQLEVHHKIPRRLGGQNDEDNLVTLCTSCHRAIETGDIRHATERCFRHYKKHQGHVALEDYNKIHKSELQTQLDEQLRALVDAIIQLKDRKELVKRVEILSDLVQKIGRI